MRRHGMPCVNQNEKGQLLIAFCGKHGLIIGGMAFPHRDRHKVTWVSRNKYKQVQNQIDNLCISRSWNKSLMDVEHKRGADIGSAHHMIMGILRIKVQKLRGRLKNRK